MLLMIQYICHIYLQFINMSDYHINSFTFCCALYLLIITIGGFILMTYLISTKLFFFPFSIHQFPQFTNFFARKHKPPQASNTYENWNYTYSEALEQQMSWDCGIILQVLSKGEMLMNMLDVVGNYAFGGWSVDFLHVLCERQIKERLHRMAEWNKIVMLLSSVGDYGNACSGWLHCTY